SQVPVVSRATGTRRASVLARVRTAEALAARRPGNRPRGSLLFRPPRPDQDHERGLGLVLALDDHDPEDPSPLGARRLRRPPLGDNGHPAWPPQSLQAWYRAAARYRRALEQGAIRSGMGGMR